MKQITRNMIIDGIFGVAFLLLILGLSYALEECKGTSTSDEIPCYILLPTTQNCSILTVSYYRNGSNFLQTRTLTQYSPFTCNQTFNYSTPDTYTFNFSTGDTGSIIVEAGPMNFFNLLVYLVFTAIILVLIAFMHIFRESSGSSIVYGWVATAIGVILGSIVVAPGFTVITDVILFIDADIYLAAISFILAFYTAAVSVNIRNSMKPKEEAHW